MLPTLIIGLREGLEASLIVGIVAAFLRKEGRRDALRQVWVGVGLALVLCAAVGVALELANRDLSQQKQEGLETVIGLIAVAMVTYMVVWMKRNSGDLKRDLEGVARSALATNSARALVIMAFLAVLREGFETAVFLIAQFNETSNPGLAGTGAAVGIVIAVILGYVLYRGGVRINLSKFFRATGLVLVLVAAGLLATAAMTAHEAGWLDAGQREAMNISAVVRPGTVLESVLTGVLGWQARPTVIMTVLYVLYLVPMAVYVAWPQQVRAAARRIAAATEPAPTGGSGLSRPQLALRSVVALVVVAGAATLVGTYGSTSKASVGATSPGVVTVTLAGSGCSLSTATVPSGPTTFVVRNVGTGRYTEAELLGPGGGIVAERENVVSNQAASFVFAPDPGTYAIQCGTGTKKLPLTVTAATGPQRAGSSPATAQLAAATTGYRSYAQQQAGLLQTRTRVLTDAVRAGDLTAARAAYPAARVYYERIEPVAESFGDLDPLIDNRLDDAGSLAQLTGFHRLEYAMYVSKSLAGMAPVASQLDANVATLMARVSAVSFEPAQLANGATTLLDEIGKTKVTGEEERYSHIDLVDLAANVAGSQQAYELLAPAVQTLDPSLASRVQAQFGNVDRLLQSYATGSGPADYRSYSSVPQAGRKTISQAVDALAAPLSQVAGVVVKG